MIRRVTVEDIPRALEMAAAAYPERRVAMGEDWARWVVGHPDRICLISDEALGVASIVTRYGHERRAQLDLLASLNPRSFDPVRMLRAMIEWARSRQAVGAFKIDSDTGVDFGPFVRRLGGRAVTNKRYEVVL